MLGPFDAAHGVVPMRLPLFARYPALEPVIPRFPLLDRPTPVRWLDRLSPGSGSLWIKCDDGTVQPYGGNKPRKLEFLLADAQRRGIRQLLTVGGLGSNHALATCLYGRRAGFPVDLLLFRQPLSEHVRMSLKLLGRHAAHMKLGSSYDDLPSLVDEWLRAHPGGEFIPAGGSTPLGTLGFVNAAFELAEQVEAREMPEPAALVVAAGSCATMAGLILGLRLAGLSTPVVGVQVVEPVMTNPITILGLIHGAQEILAAADPAIPRPAIDASHIDLRSNYFGSGYGHRTAEGDAALALAREQEGIVLESTYTAKTLACALDEARLKSGPILFWNTYAGPVLKAEADAIPDRDLPPEFAALFAERAL
jgi:D-cysteine desulfhydrase